MSEESEQSTVDCDDCSKTISSTEIWSDEFGLSVLCKECAEKRMNKSD
jgi:hypothetical protein